MAKRFKLYLFFIIYGIIHQEKYLFFLNIFYTSFSNPNYQKSCQIMKKNLWNKVFFEKTSYFWIRNFTMFLNCKFLKFHESKSDVVKAVVQVQIILVGYQSFWTFWTFWTGPNHFWQFQILKISLKKSNWNLTKMIRTCPKQIRPYQNNLYTTKIIWPVQNHFGPIEGQGTSPLNHRSSRIRKVVKTLW